MKTKASPIRNTMDITHSTITNSVSTTGTVTTFHMVNLRFQSPSFYNIIFLDHFQSTKIISGPLTFITILRQNWNQMIIMLRAWGIGRICVLGNFLRNRFSLFMLSRLHILRLGAVWMRELLSLMCFSRRIRMLQVIRQISLLKLTIKSAKSESSISKLLSSRKSNSRMTTMKYML